MKLSHAVRLLGGAGFPHDEQGGTDGTPFYKVSDLSSPGPWEAVDAAANYVDDEQLKRLRATIAPAGSVLMPKIGAAMQGKHRRVLIRKAGAFDNNVLALVPRRVDGRYLAYWALQLAIAPVTQPGAVASLDMAAFRALRLPDLTLEAQRRVADLLDRECQRVAELEQRSLQLDRLKVEAYERLLQDAVGLDQYPRVQIRYLARTGTGHTPSRSQPEWWRPDECVIPWFTLSDVWQIRDDEREVVEETSERVSAVGLANSAAVLHPERTVLLSRTASVGFSAVMGRPMAVSQDFMTWTCGPKLLPEFLLYALRAMRPELRGLMHGSTHKTIYMPDLHALTVPLPSLDIQREAVARVRSALAPHWRLRQRTHVLRDRIGEYRDALVTEAVHGQLDVGAASDLALDERAMATMEGAAA